MLKDYTRRLLDKKPSSGETLVELDGLRGLAVLIVVAGHTRFLGMKGQGALGVWLFFVLSGFLLTRIMLHSLPGTLRPHGLARYCVRRIARILPLYYLVLLLHFMEPQELFLHLTFQRAQGHFWSIPQEEVFYLLLPVLVALLLALRRLLRVPPLLATALLLGANHVYGPPFSLHGNGRWLDFMLTIFLQGMLVAFLWQATERWRSVRHRGVDLAVNVAGVPVLAAVLFSSPAHLRFYEESLGLTLPELGWAFPLRSGFLCALLLLCTLWKGTWLNRLLSLEPLRVIGVFSFAIYLVHVAVRDLGRGQLGLETAGLFAFTLVVTTLAAAVLERFVERPCMDFGKRLNARYFGGTRPVERP